MKCPFADKMLRTVVRRNNSQPAGSAGNVLYRVCTSAITKKRCSNRRNNLAYYCASVLLADSICPVKAAPPSGGYQRIAVVRHAVTAATIPPSSISNFQFSDCPPVCRWMAGRGRNTAPVIQCYPDYLE